MTKDLMPQDELDSRDLPVTSIPETIDVIVISYDNPDFAVVRGKKGEGIRLMPKKYVKNSYNAQKVPFLEFQKSNVPYDWKDEFDNFCITYETFIELMYQNGNISKTDMNYTDILSILRIRGKLPLGRK